MEQSLTSNESESAGSDHRGSYKSGQKFRLYRIGMSMKETIAPGLRWVVIVHSSRSYSMKSPLEKRWEKEKKSRQSSTETLCWCGCDWVLSVGLDGS